MQRQGMSVSVSELRRLANELEKEGKDTARKLGLKFSPRKQWQVDIVNKTKASDTWEFERDKEISKSIYRKCVVCGKRMKINVYKGGGYSKGHYFGTHEIPIGKGEYKKVSTTKMFGKDCDVVEWAGKKKKFDYWECNECYEDAFHEEWLEKKLEKIYGEKCEDYEQGCPVCGAWSVFDAIGHEHEELEG